MCGGVRGEPPVELGALAQRLEAYRRNREGRGPLPEPLWTEAARLAQEGYGVWRVQQALRLSYYGLKQRLETLPAGPSPGPAEPGRLRPVSVEQGEPTKQASAGCRARAAFEDKGRGASQTPSGHQAPPVFVELGVPAALLSGGTVLELEDRTGRKLSVRLAREDSGVLVALARALWDGAP
jgi:hypothetical protein